MTMPDFADPPFAVAPDVHDLAAAYERLGNVWKVGELFGIKGSTVHGRLKRAGLYESRQPEFTEAQIARIKDFYTNTDPADFDLNLLAQELGKSRANISRKARRLCLTEQSRPVTSTALAKMKQFTWPEGKHPRGFAGKKHSAEALAVMSSASKRTWATWKTFGTGQMTPEARAIRSERQRASIMKRPASTIHSRTKGGHREDLGGVFFRSSWEANYARYLNLLVKMKVVQSWEFEPETFWFHNIKRGVRSYLLDFKVYYTGETKPSYVEIKGWMDKKSRTKIARFKKYYPQHRLEIIGAKEYYALQRKWASAIPNWERPTPTGCRVTVKVWQP